MEYSVCLECGTKEKTESPTEIEPMTYRAPVAHSNHWATGRLMASEVISTRFIAIAHFFQLSEVRQGALSFLAEETTKRQRPALQPLTFRSQVWLANF